MPAYCVASNKVLLLGLILLFFYCGTAESQENNQQRDNNAGIRYTVQFTSSTLPNGTSVEDPEAIQDAFLQYLERNNVNVTVRYRFTDIMNGMSIMLPPDTVLPQWPPPPPSSSSSSDSSLNTTTEHHLHSNASSLVSTDFHPTAFLAQTLQTCPYVNRYWQGKRYRRPQVRRGTLSPDNVPGLPNLPAAHELTGVDQAKLSNWTGDGIRVGILDTGVDYTHPALGGCFGPGCKVAYGYDLVGDASNDGYGINPDDDPMDTCDGHGTHVAGIIAANDTKMGFEGVAPGVELGAWRIFGCQGDTDDDIILMAAEMAVKAGMDIINLSLGGGVSAWEEDALAVALSNIADKGIMVAVAQGNEGRDGIARTPSPAIGEHVMAVASFENAEKFGHVFHIADNDAHYGPFEYTMSDGRFQFPNDTQTLFPFTVLFDPTLNNTSSDEALFASVSKSCEPINVDLTGSIVLVQRGSCEFGQKAMYAQTAGAAGLLVWDRKEDEAIQIDLEGYENIDIPVGSVDGDLGHRLVKQYVDNQNQTVGFSHSLIRMPNGGKPSKFSTWGPDAELHLKPDIAGIGGTVFSTYPVSMGSYRVLSGTSMATPYLSGSTALYLQAKGRHGTKRTITALLNHASPTFLSHSDANGTELIDTPIKQGAGLVQVLDAIRGTVRVNPFKISLNDTANLPTNVTITIHNDSHDTKNFTLHHLPAASISGYNFTSSAVPLAKPKYLHAHADVHFDETSIVVHGNESAIVTIAFHPPNVKPENEHAIYGGYIEIRPQNEHDDDDGEPAVRVPYMGAQGAQRDLDILDRNRGYPFIGNRYGEPLTKIPTYNFARNDVLYLFLRIGNPTRQLRSELLYNNGTVVGNLPGLYDTWLARNDHSDENFEYAYEWNGGVYVPGPGGQYRHGRHRHHHHTKAWHHLPRGTYRLRVSALRIFGDPDLEGDWDIWESKPFHVLEDGMDMSRYSALDLLAARE